MKVTPEEQDMIDLIAETERVEALQAALATAQAQVGVMAEALESLKADCEKCGAPDEVEMTGGYGLSATSVWELVNDALSVVPKVVWSGEANNREGWPWIDSNEARRSLRKAFEKLEDGQLVTARFIVLDKQGKGE